MDGKIIKGIAGFYYVYTAGGVIYECKAKGIFRKDKRKPLVGDNAELDILSEQPPVGNIIRLKERHNELIRPAVANIDQAVIIFAVKNPEPNFNLLDRFQIMMEQQQLPCLICFNKQDLIGEEEKQRLYRIYEKSDCSVFFTSTKTGAGIPELRAALEGRTSTVAGPSGVGKSSLVNCMLESNEMETGELSEKIMRGKNTTRHTSFTAVNEHTFILDTPGFSSLAVFDLEKEDLRFYYPELAPYEDTCRFHGCMHVSEPDCSVKKALADGEVSRIRYENYVQLFEELKAQKKY